MCEPISRSQTAVTHPRLCVEGNSSLLQKLSNPSLRLSDFFLSIPCCCQAQHTQSWSECSPCPGSLPSESPRYVSAFVTQATGQLLRFAKQRPLPLCEVAQERSAHASFRSQRCLLSCCIREAVGALCTGQDTQHDSGRAALNHTCCCRRCTCVCTCSVLVWQHQSFSYLAR